MTFSKAGVYFCVSDAFKENTKREREIGTGARLYYSYLLKPQSGLRALDESSLSDSAQSSTTELDPSLSA